jgi:hypothetical protein
MPIARWIGLISTALAASVNCAPSHPALSAELPVKPDHATQAAAPAGRLCTDMEGKTFRWSWPNVPFAAVCSDDAKDARLSAHPRQPPQ